MKTVQQIYSNYKTIPALQAHQLRVASVAKTICRSFKQKIDTNNIVLACLFHDMGNIIKSELERFPDFLKPQGLEYWQIIKEEYIKKYGREEHKATEIIATEIKLTANVLDLLKKIGFSNLGKVDLEGTFENKICSYSDMRVGPYGVIPIEERLSEARNRYEGRNHAVASDCFESLANCLRNIERDIFIHSDLLPGDINDEIIKETEKSLKSLVVSS